MNEKMRHYLETARTYNGEKVKDWLDRLIDQNPTHFGFGLEYYGLAKGQYVIGWYSDKENGKYFDLSPRDRAYVLERLYPDTESFMRDYNDCNDQATVMELLEELPKKKIEEGLKHSLEDFLMYKYVCLFPND